MLGTGTKYLYWQKAQVVSPRWEMSSSLVLGCEWAACGTEQGSTAAPGFSFSGLALTLLDERKTEIFCLVASTQLEETPDI